MPEPQNERELKREIERTKKAQARALKSGKKVSDTHEKKVDTNYIIDNVIHTIISVDKL